MSDSWEIARESYVGGRLKRQELWPYWKQEVESLMKIEVSEDREHQLKPLFDNSWGPKDAADHLLRVWALKGWIKAND